MDRLVIHIDVDSQRLGVKGLGPFLFARRGVMRCDASDMDLAVGGFGG